MLRSNKNIFPIIQKTISKDVYEIQKYIDRHFMEDIKISELAKRNHISQYYLSHSFKKLCGYSPKQYLLMTRLSFARELLTITDCSIKEIAYKCCFNDVNNFIRVFKREYNMTPKQYRLTYINKDGNI